MINKTRKYAWPASAMMAIALVAALAAFIVLSGSSGVALAHEPDTNVDNHCAGQSTIAHDVVSDIQGLYNADGTPHNCASPGTEPTPEPTPEPPTVELTAPTMVSVAALDNTMTVRWSPPQGYDEDATIIGYEITQTLYVQDANNPIANTPALMKMAEADATEVKFRGLSYSTYYSHTVQAIFTYTDADGNLMTKKGPVSATVTKRTADSGGILYPAETPPSMPMNLTADLSVPDAQICQPLPDSGVWGHVELAWDAPADAGQGTPPNLDPGDCEGDCTNVTPPHTGGDNAGIELLGEDAVVVSYTVERRVSGRAWTRMASVDDLLYYTDISVTSGMTYEYRVRAVNSVGLIGAWSPAQEIEVGSLIDPPGRPSSLVTTIKSPSGDDVIEDVELQWDPPLGAWRTEADAANGYSEDVAYCIQRQDGGSDTAGWMRVREQPHKYSPDGIGTVLTQEYTDGDAPEGEVTYRVAAVYAHVRPDDPDTPEDETEILSVLSGPSLWNEASEVKTVTRTVMPTEPVGDPIGLSATNGSSPGTATVTWTAAANATAQWVYGHNYTTDSGMYVAAVEGDATSATISDLNSGDNYVFIVVAGQMVDGGEPSYSMWSNWSGIVTIE